VNFHPVEKDYLIGVNGTGMVFLLKVNSSDFTLKKVHEIDLGMTDCRNVAFNGRGNIAIVVGLDSLFGVIEIGRNETDLDQLVLKRKRISSGGGID
jgi:hypothetical protein